METQSIVDDKVTTSCGATSSKCPRFDLIPLEGLVGLARRFEDGLEKHGKEDWRKGVGDKDFVIERLNHAIYHAKKMIEKLEGRRPDDGDDDASAIAWAGVTVTVMAKSLLGVGR